MTSVKIYCGGCGEYVPLIIEPLHVDELNGETIWGDVVCPECHFVIDTLTADEPGTYDIVKTDD